MRGVTRRKDATPPARGCSRDVNLTVPLAELIDPDGVPLRPRPYADDVKPERLRLRGDARADASEPEHDEPLAIRGPKRPRLPNVIELLPEESGKMKVEHHHGAHDVVREDFVVDTRSGRHPDARAKRA